MVNKTKNLYLALTLAGGLLCMGGGYSLDKGVFSKNHRDYESMAPVISSSEENVSELLKSLPKLGERDLSYLDSLKVELDLKKNNLEKYKKPKNYELKDTLGFLLELSGLGLVLVPAAKIRQNLRRKSLKNKLEESKNAK
jgi:hypothetical protein